ncbi:MAG: DNA repair protein RadA [Spirochaetia bacterium]|nr:DNA repair protein RadA [Spirochaetia bacterium]
MAKKFRKLFLCSECGNEFTRWSGKCPSCFSWNTLSESEASVRSSLQKEKQETLTLVSEIPLEGLKRVSSGVPEFDRILGGGIVPGSFMLAGGEPGVGKSTLILEIARRFSGSLYYFSGEESPSQIKIRADRMGVNSEKLFLSGETLLDNLCSRIELEKPDLAVIDSVQTVLCPEIDSTPGSVSQLREAAYRLMETAKKCRVPILATGHITKEGAIAGPRILEHMVDTVMYFESDRLNHHRILRAIKNRFGPVGEAAIFEMRSTGLTEISNLNIVRMEKPVPGRMFSSFVEGTRPLAVEVQALVSRTLYGPGKRMAEGLDSRRLNLLAAVMEKFLKLSLSDSDIFINLAGGLNADDPALDLAVCSAILSSYREVPGDDSTALIGEIGLSGEVRSVGHLSSRIKELASLGFNKIIIPLSGSKEDYSQNVELIGIEHLSELPLIGKTDNDFKLEGTLS